MEMMAILALDGGLLGGPDMYPWALQDLRREVFELLKEKTAISGRRTWELWGTELPVAGGVVLSRSSSEIPPGALMVVPNLNVASERAQNLDRDVVVVGGATVFRQALPVVDVLHLAYVKQKPAETLPFPMVKPELWWVESVREHPAYEWVTYRRRNVA